MWRGKEKDVEHEITSHKSSPEIRNGNERINWIEMINNRVIMRSFGDFVQINNKVLH